MLDRSLLYYITDRRAFSGDEHTRRSRVLDKIAEATANGIDYIQLREKDLSARELESLAREAVRLIGETRVSTGDRQVTQLLVNSRADVALAVNAAGVHLRSNDIPPEYVRTVWKSSSAKSPAAIGVSCHTPDEVFLAAANAASLAVFGPIFGKKNAQEPRATGLEVLRNACRAGIPVFAIGGITVENAGSCLSAGASGIAAIRLFQENDISTIVRAFRSSQK
jgi:thiamine-phosphate pyrophosphorylase